MKRFKEIIQSTVEPSNTNVLWLNPDIDELLYYSSNGWSPIYQDSSIIEPKSVRIERVETHIGKGAEYGDRSYFLYKANINPSSANVPYQVSWGFDIIKTVGYDKMAVDPKDNHYCKVFIDNAQPKDSGFLVATVTYGNKIIKGTTIVQYCSYLTINIESNLKGIDDFVFENLPEQIKLIPSGSDNGQSITSGQTIPVVPNQQYIIGIADQIATLYDFLEYSNTAEDSGSIIGYYYDIVTPDIGSHLTKTIKCKARAVKVTHNYKNKAISSPVMALSNTYDPNLVVGDQGYAGIRPDGTYISIRPYRFKKVRLVSFPVEPGESTGETDRQVFFDDIVTDNFEDDYTEVTLEGFTLEEREDIAIATGNNPVNGNNEVYEILRDNITVPRSNYYFFTKEEVAKITDIGTWFQGSNIKTFDEFQYFTGITELKNMAFFNCTSLTSIIIPENITVIPDQCFHSCHKLSNIILHDKIKTLGNYAFNACNLTSISLSNSLTSIGSYCLGMNSNLSDITIPNSVKIIGSGAFQYCSKLSSISIPSSIRTISDYTFQNSGLTSINIPSSVGTIESSAFQGCSKLTSVTIEGIDITINDCAFENCTNLSNLDCSKLNANFSSNIGQCAFRNTIIQNLYLPGNAGIGANAFQNDIGKSKLETVIIGTGFSYTTHSIGAYAFAGHPKLKAITIKMTYYGSQPGYNIPQSVFDGAGSNGTIYVPANTSKWETQPGIKYLLDNKGWTISYTL